MRVHHVPAPLGVRPNTIKRPTELGVDAAEVNFLFFHQLRYFITGKASSSAT